MNENVLNSLLVEFFENQRTSADRKREIEYNLANFKKQPDALRVSRQWLESPQTSPYVAFYALSIYEDLLCRWYDASVRAEDRADTRSFLFRVLTTSHQRFPPFVTNKLVKLVVDIAKKEFPHDWPDLMQQVYDLRQSSLMLCLVLCKTICEEFVANREDMPAARKADLKMHLLQEVPSIMVVAVEVLVNIHETCIKSPPFASPTDGVAGGFGMGMHSPVRSPHAVNFPMVGESPSKAAFPLSPARSNGLSNEAIIHGGQIHGDNVVLCRLALDALHSLVSWVPISEETHASLVIDTIFKFAQLTDGGTVELGSLGMTCINEVMSRNHVPQEFFTFIMLITKQVCEMMRYLTSDVPGGAPRIVGIDATYQEKLIEFLEHFVGKHISRAAESVPDFPLEEFLVLLFKFTFHQPSPEAYLSCLHIWDVFEDQLIAKQADPKAGVLHVQRLQGGLLGLSREVMRKVQFTEYPEDLNAFGDDLTENGENEWELYLRTSCDLVADLYPDGVLQSLFELFMKHSDLLFSARGQVPSEPVRYAALDLRAVLAVFGRVSHVFTANFRGGLSAATTIIERLLGILNVDGVRQPNSIAKSKASDAYEQLAVQTFSTLSVFIHWFELYRVEAVHNQADLAGFQRLLLPLINFSLDAMSSRKNISNASSALLYSIASTVKPDILAYDPISQYLTIVHSASISYPHTTMKNVYKFITAMYVLPHTGNASERVLGSSPAAMQKNEVKVPIRHTIDVMCAMMETVQSEGTQPKEIVHQSLAPLVRPTIQLVRVYAHDHTILPLLLDFILQLFSSLRKQVTRDTNLLQDTLNLFLSMLKGNDLKRSILDGPGNAVLDKFILIIGSLVGDKAFEKMLPGIIHFLDVEICGQCIADESLGIDEIRSHFYEVLHQIVLQHSRWFFGSQVARMAGARSGGETHEKELLGILNMIARTFQMSSMDVFRQNLLTLQDLDSKTKLYSKDVFKQSMLLPFIEMLLDCLLGKSRDFLRDDLIAVLGGMILTDLALNINFLFQLIPAFITTRCGGMTLEQHKVLANYLQAIQDSQNCGELLNTVVNDYGFFAQTAGAGR
ncbi:Exportin-6 [Rhizophlyctis rosea]|uniref:Exportin-6 n=1 Tax=Rhizophlyctis rosea TaxID=64517 RepID=A0AAD5SHQ8_9FUNG|nr:Exportin-6 [Rhizophlyctis rosea]